MREPEIFCPLCRWRPQAESRWHCVPSCGTVWNTFWTAGTCPGCAHRWTQTQCLACQKFSPHRNWYHEPPDDTARDVSAQRVESSALS